MIITITATIMWNIVCIGLLQKEWNRKDAKFITYAAIMLACTTVLAVILTTVYKETSTIHHLKRIAIVTLLFLIAPIDYKESKIPNKFLVVGLALRGVLLVGEILFEREQLLLTISSEGLALVTITIISVICMLIIKNSIGAGDIKLMLLMCLFQGLAGVGGALFSAMVISFFIAVVLLITKKKSRKDAIPFAPSVLIGTYLSVFLIGA